MHITEADLEFDKIFATTLSKYKWKADPASIDAIIRMREDSDTDIEQEQYDRLTYFDEEDDCPVPWKRSRSGSPDPPPCPRMNPGVPFFITSVDPSPYLHDEDFVGFINQGTPRAQNLHLNPSLVSQ